VPALLGDFGGDYFGSKEVGLMQVLPSASTWVCGTSVGSSFHGMMQTQ